VVDISLFKSITVRSMIVKKTLLAKAIFVSIVVASTSSLFLISFGKDPITSFYYFFLNAFSYPHGIAESLIKATPLILCSTGLLYAFNSDFLNIGAEGQLHIGAAFAVWLGLSFGGLPPILVLIAAGLFGFIGGGIWALIPMVLKIKLKVNEVLSTLMMNSIGILLVNYLVSDPWRDKAGWELWTPDLSSSYWLPKIIAGTRLHIGFLIALSFVVVYFIILNKTALGYKSKVMGKSRAIANYAGISILKTSLLVALLSGGLAGIAGMIEIYGVQHHLLVGFSPGYGYFAILVAFLSGASFLSATVLSILFGILIVGGMGIQLMGVPDAISRIIVGMLFLAIVLTKIFNKSKNSGAQVNGEKLWP